MRVSVWAGVAALTLGVVAAGVGLKRWQERQEVLEALEWKVQGVRATSKSAPDCDQLLQGRTPVVILVMGQSNAANHSDLSPSPGTLRPAIPVLHDGQCRLSREPLPGGTGEGASFWSALNVQLGGRWRDRPIVWAVVAVGSTAVADWVESDSPVRAYWERQVDAVASSGWPVAAVLWQQGETDSGMETSSDAYAKALRQLRGLVAARGVSGPWWLAGSTSCYGPPHTPGSERIRKAIRALVDEPGSGFRAGADTDSLAPALRNGCHFTAAGVDRAALLWRHALVGADSAQP